VEDAKNLFPRGSPISGHLLDRGDVGFWAKIPFFDYLQIVKKLAVLDVDDAAPLNQQFGVMDNIDNSEVGVPGGASGIADSGAYCEWVPVKLGK
jgi:hypothetical protein